MSAPSSLQGLLLAPTPPTTAVSCKESNQALPPHIEQPLQASNHLPAIRESLPPELLVSLKKKQQTQKDFTHLPPVNGAQVTGPPANIWNHPKQRSKFKHLTDCPPCICGSGRDISFLYDVVADGKKKSSTLKTLHEEMPPLPSTLIPNEFHVVKHPQVLGLEYVDSQFATQTCNHVDHMTVFPSMNPTGRHEVAYLKHTLDQMLQNAGIQQDLKNSDLKGPTQIHNLLELVHKEQTIYNICFHELIRQVSVQCVERGELMAELRRRYSNLLDRIPHQVKSLHKEMVAQRTLDRRLTSELSRFKHSVSKLTNDLGKFNDTETNVSIEVTSAHENLASSLTESERNMNLLTEYHMLYELQRNRTENQLTHLSFEKDRWQQACYNLASKVAKHYNLKTVKRLQLCEHSWAELASHFAVTLSDRDTQELSMIDDLIKEWKKLITNFVNKLSAMEQSMIKQLSLVEDSLQQWLQEEKSSGKKILERHMIENLWINLKQWQDIANFQSEQFAGEVLLERQEQMKEIENVFYQWTELAIGITRRHPSKQDKQHKEGTVMKNDDSKESAEADDGVTNEPLTKLISKISTFVQKLLSRSSGENGVAVGYVHLLTPMENWDAKLNVACNSDDHRALKNIEFLEELQLWVPRIHKLRDMVADSCNMEVDSCNGISLEDLLASVDSWCLSFAQLVKSKDIKLSGQVFQVHSSMMQWTVELLLCLSSLKDREVENQGSHMDTNDYETIGTADNTTEKTLFSKISDLNIKHSLFIQSLPVFTKNLIKSCTGIVHEIVDKRRSEGYRDPEEEQRQLEKITDETEEWMKLSELLLGQLISERSQFIQTAEAKMDNESDKELQQLNKSTEMVDSLPLPSDMKVLGIDGNVKTKPLQQAFNETLLPPTLAPLQLDLATEEFLPEGRGVLLKDSEMLVIELDQARNKLVEQEEQILAAEERAIAAEKELHQKIEKVAELESKMQKLIEESQNKQLARIKPSKASKNIKQTRPVSRKR